MRRFVILIIALGAISLFPLSFRSAPTDDIWLDDIWLHCKHAEVQDENPSLLPAGGGTSDTSTAINTSLRIVANRVFIRTVGDRAHGCASSEFLCVEWLRAGNRRVFVTTEPLPNWNMPNSSLASLGDLFVIREFLYPFNVYHLSIDNVLPLLMVAYSYFGRHVSSSMLKRLQVATLQYAPVCPAIQIAITLGLPPIQALASLADRIHENEYFEAVVLAPTRRVLEETMANRIPWTDWASSSHHLPAVRRVIVPAVGLVVTHAKTAHADLYPEGNLVFIVRAKSRRFRGLGAVLKALQGAAFQRSLEQLGASAARVRFVDMQELTFTQQVALASSARMVAGMHGAGLTHFLFTQPGTACIQLLAHGFLECDARLGYANMARFAGCIYNEYEFPYARTFYKWSIDSYLNGDVLAKRPRCIFGKDFFHWLQGGAETDQDYDMFDAQAVLLPSDVLRIVSMALNTSLAVDPARAAGAADALTKAVD